MSDFMRTTNTFQFDSLDPVDTVLKTDERFETAMATANTTEEVIAKVEESGCILEGRVDERIYMQPLTEDSYDLSNPVDLAMLGEECCDEEDCEDEDLYDDDGEMIDEVIGGFSGGEPGTAEDFADNEMIDAVDKGNVDSTGYAVEESYMGWGSENVFLEKCGTSDAADVSTGDDDEEPVNEIEEAADPFGYSEF